MLRKIRGIVNFGNPHLSDIIFIGFFFIASVLSSKAIWNVMTIIGSYQLTDWGFNYAGGFIRRGLSGQILLMLSDWMGLTFNIIAPSVAIVANLIFMVCAAILLYPVRKNHWCWLLIYTPGLFCATCLYPMLGGHKDGVLLAIAASIFVGAAYIDHQTRKTIWVLCGLAFTVPLMLIHEGYVIFLPIIFTALLSVKLKPITVSLAAIILIADFIAVLASVKASGTIEQRDAMMQVYYAALPVEWSIWPLSDSGAFWHVGLSLSETVEVMRDFSFKGLNELPVMLLLVVGPLVVVILAIKPRALFSGFDGRATLILMALSWGGVIILMPIAIDWTRFFSMTAMLCILVAAMRLKLTMSPDAISDLPGAGASPNNARVRYGLGWGIVASLFLLKPGKVAPNLVYFDWKDVVAVLLIIFVATRGVIYERQVRRAESAQGDTSQPDVDHKNFKSKSE